MNDQQAKDLALSLPASSNEIREKESGNLLKHSKVSPKISEKQALPIPRYAPFTIEKDTKFASYNHEEERRPLSPSSSSSSSPNSNYKTEVDNQVRCILGLPKTELSSEDIWPYSTETLNEIIRFKIQQEATKQETARKETCRTALELLRLVKEMHINEDLVPFLFMPGAINTEHLRMQIYKIQLEPNELLRKATEEYNRTKTPESNINKRKYLDIHLPSFHETAESIKTYSSSIVSPLRSPNKSPATSHRRVISDSSEATTHGNPLGTQSPPAQSKMVLPFPQQAHSSFQPNGNAPLPHATLPPIPTQQYPHSYYHQYPPIMDKAKSLGSPYSQKYQPYVGPGVQYPYYGAQSPNNLAYILPQPPITTNAAHNLSVQNTQGSTSNNGSSTSTPATNNATTKKQNVPSHHFETACDSGNRFSAVTQEDISPQHKKQKQKHNSINFMITTPKNPPARKYNNTNADKS